MKQPTESIGEEFYWRIWDLRMSTGDNVYLCKMVVDTGNVMCKTDEWRLGGYSEVKWWYSWVWMVSMLFRIPTRLIFHFMIIRIVQLKEGYIHKSERPCACNSVNFMKLQRRYIIVWEIIETATTRLARNKNYNC